MGMSKEDPTPPAPSMSGKAGEWVVVRRGVVVGSDMDMAKVLAIARTYPEGEVYISRILFPGASFY